MKNYFQIIRLRLLEKFKKRLTPKQYLSKRFKIVLGYKLNWSNPKTFNEKLQWLKLNYDNENCTICADKILVKDYVSNLLGSKYIIPTIGVYNSADEIPFNDLPNRFVIKCNHNSGKGLVVCQDKTRLDIAKVKKEISVGLKEDYYSKYFETPYKNIKRKILIEEFLDEGNNSSLVDYKFYCFNGKPEFLLVATNRNIDVRFDYFDMELRPLDFEQGGKRSGLVLQNFKEFEEMKNIASKLSEGFPHARIDLYKVNGQIYFGEITFFDSAGFGKFKPKKWDRIFGDCLVLPENNKK